MGKLIIKNRYGIAPNELLNSKEISLKAKGMFTYLQSKPDGWQFSVERIATQMKESVDTVRKTLQELEDFGYLERELKKRTEDGKFAGYDYILYSYPVGKIRPRKNHRTANPSTEKFQDISNKDNSKKDISNKDNNILITNSELKNSPPKKKRKNFKVPNEVYKEILDAYQKYKGIQLSGAEFGEAKRAIKTILYSGRTKENILDFMKFCYQVQDDPDYSWLKHWTMLTIKRKMPEFLAGKFKKVEEDDWHLVKPSKKNKL